MRWQGWIKGLVGVHCVWLTAMAHADTRDADALFVQGKFAEALAAYEAIPAGSPSAQTALRRQGTIHLMANRSAEAEAKLKAALARDPNDRQAAAAMAELESRRNNFVEAARWFAVAGRPERAQAFALFGTDRPYRLVSHAADVTVPFVHTDPLPAVVATANGEAGLFILDTGAAETILDPAFAKAIDVPVAGSEQGTFAGGKTANVAYGRLARLRLGTLELADVPVALIDTRKFAAAAHGKKVVGVIGTSLFARFTTTIDYVAGTLTLATGRRETKTSSASIPFWQLGDHFLLAEGRLNDGPPQMFFVDTGLAGYALTAPASTLKNAGIDVPTPKPETDGGIGTAAVAPFVARSLALGTLRQENLPGLYGAFPPSLEMGLGTRIGAIISHGFFRPYAITFDFKAMTIDVHDVKK